MVEAFCCSRGIQVEQNDLFETQDAKGVKVIRFNGFTNGLVHMKLEGLTRLHSEIQKLTSLVQEKLSKNETVGREMNQLRTMFNLQIECAKSFPETLLHP